MTTKLADDPQTEAAKKAVADEKKASDKSRTEFAERTKGKPTPTQEENDLAMCGAHILEHEDDGSGPDPHQAKVLEAEKPSARPAGNYQTRSAHRSE
ncbi:hypothetical protein NLM33_18720 [Bradyrhizobium sp. CCGUVB1N3]|uniref:hypothetical protein n=1 Tax=Bradyrhizobium sp. CCGUVB1N3 TaxID=2949629 RepID=UPI0020B2BEEB|nr:hypothetical protein [Bradyrhizobium sp. CCGUVB1N3]MCP3471412.1 hypothetical protein [Bradyrhizobium sp. CCGUVB1N3]MCP3472352.1 hypothetical protein [Bradyrhizobium sp. CCGUVB1N3]